MARAKLSLCPNVRPDPNLCDPNLCAKLSLCPNVRPDPNLRADLARAKLSLCPNVRPDPNFCVRAKLSLCPNVRPDPNLCDPNLCVTPIYCARLAKKLNVLDLARMVGHKDLRQLQVYYNETDETMAARMD